MKPWAIVTGASSGIGKELARQLDEKGYSLLLVARREDRLLALQKELQQPSEILVLDISSVEACRRLHAHCADKNVEILINNAGFGSISEFTEDALKSDIAMIDTNIVALHALCKLFLSDFIKKDKGYILNVASMAGLTPAGPYMATYYASKCYVTSLSAALAMELKERGSHVYIGSLNPGPVHTEFGIVARAGRAIRQSASPGTLSAQRCARLGLDGMFAKKTLIIPGFLMKALYIANKLLPRKLSIRLVAKVQKAKIQS